MNKSIIHSIGLVSLLLFTTCALAQNDDVKVLSASNPAYSNDIKMGDVLDRTLAIEVDASYQLTKTSLPIKGENNNGIELRDVMVKTTNHSNKKIITIELSYQVFASAAKPVVMELPDEHIALSAGIKALSIDIPAWRFWYSPLVAEGITNAKNNLQPQSKPAQIDLTGHLIGLWVSVALLVSGLFGLVYVNADKQWLPFMNGPFAQAHRNIKKLKHDQTSVRDAFRYMHQAFNKIYGENLFANDLDQFLATHPKYLKLGEEISKFFDQSNISLFASRHANDTQFLQDLLMLSKRLRDCERGV